MNEYLHRLMSSYYNITPPKTFNGKKLPHYTDELTSDNKFSSYYNLTPPKNFSSSSPLTHFGALYFAPVQVELSISENSMVK